MAEIAQSSGDSKGKVRRNKASTRIDMTPMVDLAFLLLTFFMLTMAFNDPYIIKIEMPDKPDGHTPQPTISRSKVITLVLGEKNKIYWYNGDEKPTINLTSFSNTGVRKLILDKKASIEGLHVFIKPSDKSKYRNVIDILDEMIITGFKNYSLGKATAEDLQLIAESKL